MLQTFQVPNGTAIEFSILFWYWHHVNFKFFWFR